MDVMDVCSSKAGKRSASAPLAAQPKRSRLLAAWPTTSTSIIFDLETTGIPARIQCGLMPDYWMHDAYDGARMVSIAWRVLGPAPDFDVIKDEYRVVYPNGFTVPPQATAVHGISHQDAEHDGVQLATVLDDLLEDLARCDVIVAHNAQFDLSVLRSELSRMGRRDAIELTFRKHVVCTMKDGRAACRLPRIPKLGDLFRTLTGRELVGAHDARMDVDACAACYASLCRRSLAVAEATVA